MTPVVRIPIRFFKSVRFLGQKTRTDYTRYKILSTYTKKDERETKEILLHPL